MDGRSGSDGDIVVHYTAAAPPFIDQLKTTSIDGAVRFVEK
jgi:hypothetical protein